MLTSVELQRDERYSAQTKWIEKRDKAYHDRLAFVLYNMTRSTDFVTASQSEEHEFIGGVHGFVTDGSAGSASLPLRCHSESSDG